MSETVTAIIVTYNRLHFLKEILPAVQNQTRKPDAIIVVNNNSSDGTTEWLKGQNSVTVINQDNVGSSGGQYTGFKRAFELGMDWVWTMDDDVVPAGSCLEKLLSGDKKTLIRTPLRFTPAGKVYLNDCIKFNLTNPFKSFWVRIIDETDIRQKLIYADGITFEGPLIHRSVIEKIGFPEFGFFIYGDDSEYFIRASKAGFNPVIYKDAILNRKLEIVPEELNFSWKYFYVVRNIVALDVLHGNLLVRIIRPIAYLLKFIVKCKSFAQMKITFKAFFRGYFYKSKNDKLY